METTTTPGKFAAKYGLYAGLIIVAFALMLFNLDAHADPDSPAQYVNMVILLACIILPVLGYKKSQGGFISLGTCLKIGVVVGLIAAIIGAVYYFALTNFLDPELPAKMAELQQQKVLEQNPQMTQEQLDQMSEMSKKFAWVAYPAILIVNMLIGLIMGLIVGLFVKKSKPQDDSYNSESTITGLNIVAFLIPLVGLIVYLNEKNKFPEKAKSLGRSALWGFGFSIIVLLFSLFNN